MDFYFSIEYESGLSSNDDEVLAAEFCSPISHTHHSYYSSWEFIHSLNAVVEEDDIQSLCDARFYSLLVD